MVDRGITKRRVLAVFFLALAIIFSSILLVQAYVFNDRISVCDAEDNSATASNFVTACKGTYPSVCGASGDRLRCNDGINETSTFGRTSGVSYYAGVQIQQYNTSVTDCLNITNVKLCYESWGSTAPNSCSISVDANGGASYTVLSTTCPGTSANPTVTCTDATSSETWTCSNFFGSSGTRAYARMEVTKTTGSGSGTLYTDEFFFNVTYNRNFAPVTKLKSPSNAYSSSIRNVNFTCNATDDWQLSNITFYWNYGGTWKANGTNVSSGKAKTVTFKRTNLNNGAITWNCLAKDFRGVSAFASLNWTVSVNYADTIPPSVNSLVPTAGSTYNISTNVTIRANVTDASGISSVYANITQPDKTRVKVNMLPIGGNIYQAIWSNDLQKGRYNITFYANDTKGNWNRTQKTYFNRVVPPNKIFDIVNTNDKYMNYTSSVLSNVSGIINFKITLRNNNIKQIVVVGYNQNSPYSVIKIENTTSDTGFMKTYMVDLSQANLTYANLTITASGYNLLKCVNFNQTSKRCNDIQNYTLIRTGLVAGQNYTIKLTKTDPGFGETIQGAANTSDSYMSQQNPTTNYGATTSMIVGTSNNVNRKNRAIIWFNLSNIPSGAKIYAANLSLYFYQSSVTGNRTYNVYKVQQNPKRPWTELGVTWNVYNGTAWTTAGGDNVSSISASKTFNGTINKWIKWDVKNDVQNFTKDKTRNFGWIMRDTVESTTNTMRYFYSSEWTNASVWPKLEIEYDTLPTQTTPILNSTYGTNYTYETLTCYNKTTFDADKNPVKNIYNWYRNGTSVLYLNMPFEGGSTSGTATKNGTTRDYSSPQENGTVMRAVWQKNGGYDGKGAYYFNGASSYIDVPVRINTSDKDWSASLWFKVPILASTKGSPYYILQQKDTTGTGRTWIYINNTNNGLYSSLGNSARYSGVNITQTNRWYHVVMTWNANTLTWYVNGQNKNSQTFTPESANGFLRLGASKTLTFFMNGTIDDLRLWDITLSQSQVTALYQNKTNIITSYTSSNGDKWQCSITPNDGYDDGITLFSKNLTARKFPDNTPPNVTTVLVNQTMYSINDSVLIDAHVTDNIGIASVDANITKPDGTFSVIPMVYDTFTSNYDATYSNTNLLGTYTARIIAKDTSGNVNKSEKISFLITRPYFNIKKSASPNPVQIGKTITYNINYSANISKKGIVLLNFQPFKFVTNNTWPDDSPQMIESDKGTLFIVYHSRPGSNYDIYLLRSTDKGTHWSAPIQVTNEPEDDMWPNIREDANHNIIVVYSWADPVNGGNQDVVLVNSSDDGLTWTEPSKITNTPAINEMEPQIDQDSKGMYYLVYEASEGGNPSEIYIRNSTKLKGTWSNRIALTNNNYMDVDCDILYKDGLFYFAWAPANPQYQQIWFAKTANPLVNNSLDANKVAVTNNNFYNYETSVNRDNEGNLYIGWVAMLNVSEAAKANVNRTSNEVYLASSYNNGTTWTIRRVTNNNISDSYPGIMQTSGDGLYYISALEPNRGELDVTMAQRVFSPADTINATITDKLPWGTTLQSIGSGGVLQGSTIKWNFPSLFEGQSGIVSFTVKVNSTIKNGTFINNTAFGKYYDRNNHLMGNINSSTKTLAIDSLPPSVTQLSPGPLSLEKQSTTVTIKANVTDYAIIDTVYATVRIANDGTQKVVMTYNTTTKFYHGKLTSTANLGRYNYTIFANDTTKNINNSESSYFFVINDPPTTPKNITCNNKKCTGPYNSTIKLNCSGSTDPNGDPITYHIEALIDPLRGDRMLANATFQTSNDSFSFKKDIYGTSSPSQVVGNRVLNGNCTSGYCENVRLNMDNPIIGTAYSGGWNKTFTILDNPSYVNISFDYSLRLSDSTAEQDNISIAYRNPVTRSYILGPKITGVFGTTGHDSYLRGKHSYISYIPAGNYSFDVGCRLSADWNNKYGECWIDNVVIKELNTSSPGKSWIEIGTQTPSSYLLWNIYSQRPQSGVDFRCRAIDTGSMTYTAYYTVGGNATILKDTKPPWWSNNKTGPVSSAPYVKNGKYQFNITWQDNGYFSKVLIEDNFTGVKKNFTMSGPRVDEFYYTFTGLGVGTYYWKSYANDTSGNKNSTPKFIYKVVKGPPNIQVYINGSLNDYKKNVTFTANITCKMDAPGTINMTQNKTQIATGPSPLQLIKTYSTLGDFLINCSYKGNANYTSGNDTSVVRAVDQVKPVVTLRYPPNNYWNSSISPYQMKFNCSATDNYNLKNISLYLTNNHSTSFGFSTYANITGTSSSATMTVPLANGNYIWNCLGFDLKGNKAWAALNRTLKINSTTNLCTPPVSGNWILNCSTGCYWNSYLKIPANLTIKGIGILTLNATMNFTTSKQYIFQYSGCEFRIEKGGQII